MTRVNLYTNPSFADGTANTVSVGGATLSITEDYHFSGPGSLLIEKSDSANSGFASTVPISVTPGLSYGVGVYVRLPVTLPGQEEAKITLQVQWRNASNSLVETSSTAEFTLDDDDTWVRLSGVWVAPVDAAFAHVRVVQVEPGTSGAYFIVDAILFEQAEYVAGYFDNISQAEENKVVNTALSAPLPQVFNGLRLGADIVINDLVLNTIDEYGNIWICTGLDGWWGQSAPVLPDIPRGTEDGSYDVSGRYQSRFFTLTGVLFPANTEEALSAARDRLVTATNLVRKGGWLKAHEGPTKASFVRLSGAPQIETVNARGRTEFSIGLKAADPIKYEWCSKCAQGLKHTIISGAVGEGTPVNGGTADVTGIFEITGPLGAGSTIHNALTDQIMTIVSSLRGAGPVGDISLGSVTNGIATITTVANHHLIAGDTIVVAGAGSPYDSVDETYTVIAASQAFPYTVNFALLSDDLFEEPLNGQILLAENDLLVVDTYNRTVTYNGEATGHRNKLATLTDWITFAPGSNLIEFNDSIDQIAVAGKELTDDVAKLTSADTHYLIAGESVIVSLNEVAELATKSLTSNVVTLTTTEPHGFSAGDLIDVESVELSIVDQKSASGTEATLRTVEESGTNVTDVVTVALPVNAAPTTKALTSNTATITTQQPHGFSAGDTVVVALPASASLQNKQLSSNQAILTTTASHGYQIGDSVTVTLPVSATITGKSASSGEATLTTSAPHGFASGDSITISLPTTATLTNTRAIGGETGDYLVTLNTSTDHGFSVGDFVTVDVGVVDTLSVTNREASGTLRTLTIGSHGFSVGEKIVVSGVTANYNGTFYISAVTGTTISYQFGASFTEGSIASGGSVYNHAIAVSYNGVGKIIESIPSSTSFTYLAYQQGEATSSTATGTSPVLTNTTNQTFNGTKTITSVTSTQFSYSI